MFGTNSFALKLTAFCVGCAALWFVAPALVVGVFACIVTGVTLGFVAMLVLTNWLYMDYEVAGARGFWSGVALAAAAIAGKTAYLGTVAGGAVTAGLSLYLWQAATTVAIVACVSAVVVVAVWAVLVALAPRLSE